MKEFIKLILKFTVILFLLFAIILGAIVLYTKISGKDVNDSPLSLFTDTKETKTVLIAGLHPDGPLTDFILLARYSPKSGKINALSIPRDTKVIGSIDGKINSTYAKKRNMQDLVDKVTEITSVSIDNYVLLDTKAVKKMVDAIGGIPMDIPFDMKYDDNEQNLHIDLKKGPQVLNGDKAEQFIRFRKNNDGTGYALGDVQRIEAQKEFIKSAVQTVLKPSIITKLPELIKLGFELIKTDINIADVLEYLDDVKKFDPDNLHIETLPGEGMYIDNISYYVHDAKKTVEVVERLFNNIDVVDETTDDTSNSEDKTVKNSKEEISIEVLNGTSKNGLANSVAEKLKEEGYNVTKIGNYKTTTNINTSIINRTSVNYAKEIKDFLGKGAIKNEIEDDAKVDVTVILGSDYKS
ncbi:MAG: LCP family protein [Clostridia bacterium]|nr:LCP family protein [Clostridia bacterium]